MLVRWNKFSLELEMPRSERQKEIRRKSDLKIRRRNRIAIRTYLSQNPCIVCNFDNIFALEFHHRASDTKRESVSSLSRRAIGWHQIEAEILKCDVLCTNCHRKEHATDWYRVLDSVGKTKDRRYKASNIRRLLTILESSSCTHCGENDPIVLDFDHLDPSTKISSVANLVCRHRGWAKTAREIAKCQVLCGNCHKIKTRKDEYMSVYVASGLANCAAASGLAHELEIRGFPITYKWYDHGYIGNDQAEAKQNAAKAELAGVHEADILVVLLPGFLGTHLELGYALALQDEGHKKDIVIIGAHDVERPPSFYLLDNIRHYQSVSEFLSSDLIDGRPVSS